MTKLQQSKGAVMHLTLGRRIPWKAWAHASWRQKVKRMAS